MVRQTLARAVLRAALPALALAVALPPPTGLAATLALPVDNGGSSPAASDVASDGFPAIVDRYGAAVVTIRTSAFDPQTGEPTFAILDPDDPLAAFFRRGAPPRAHGPQPPAPDTSPRAITGSGSGFIVSPDGAILTSAHVIGDATDATVRLANGREFRATVVAVDPQSDVAVLRIDGARLPYVPIAEATRVRAGEPVMTIGAPDGAGNTVTAGIVSATPRRLPDGSAFPFLQTDIAVNPDNSGGPVFDRAGNVVGIAMQVYTGADRYASLTFAIPIALSAKLRAQLQPPAQAARGSGANALGLDVQDVGAGLAAALGLPRASGALVDGVEAGSPAAVAGVRAGDVIVQFGDRPVAGAAELNDLAATLAPGEQAPMRLIRNRAPVVLTVAVNDDRGANAVGTDGVTGVAGGSGGEDESGATGLGANGLGMAGSRTGGAGAAGAGTAGAAATHLHAAGSGAVRATGAGPDTAGSRVVGSNAADLGAGSSAARSSGTHSGAAGSGVASSGTTRSVAAGAGAAGSSTTRPVAAGSGAAGAGSAGSSTSRSIAAGSRAAGAGAASSSTTRSAAAGVAGSGAAGSGAAGIGAAGVGAAGLGSAGSGATDAGAPALRAAGTAGEDGDDVVPAATATRAAPAMQTAAAPVGTATVTRTAARPPQHGDRLGLTMHPLTDDERRSTGLPVGMMVDAVRGPAARAGIEPGDVVLELNDTLLESPADVPALEANGGDVIAVLIQRNHARRFVSVRVR
ncbi:trypsin-like peptidase domain-containing protein [Burkholderia multivorans]|uniref:trypsin-like peptidase domain-containing protein n=1 Tax=Burkholderia multivorans TaxID=87883 RepID=UPI00201A1DC2|nr:trypsin-like peptidase domain-containing protein [Burkholderia multivorans]MCL4648967.1 trypsin-like peptidase domain-containing protein [Burkholderia multivorans]MCL4657823.1 trypsin-like peptidase domain-containing protein [Burkholderia multivorans]MCO1423748.1 trypsin-like peptidase domain-containing protein [Burkholderia multivorans]UQN55678.1 trypsin-like peptidase domain-containing protein [Burkholderia multivorans]UQN81294.1 trypsin-like peptidase domain-containing protein [Burkholde